MKPRTRSAHVWVTVEAVPHRLSIDRHGNLTVRRKYQRKGLTLKAEELVRTAERLREGSLGL